MASHGCLSLGAVEFAAWLGRQKSQRKAAELIGCGQQYASKIAIGRAVPRSFKLVDRIREVCGIDPQKWQDPSRLRVPAPVRRKKLRRRRRATEALRRAA
jgi:transcriptional regulator with XRE-family HTH domain